MKIYHHNDLDGRCAAAITLRYDIDGPPSYKGIELIELDYKDAIDVDKIQKDENIVIVDFSFNPDVMEEVLKKTEHIVWIDHHKTAFEYKYSKEIAGIRNKDFAACELAWDYFKGGEMPEAVALIGDYDKWALKFEPKCFQFYEGMKLEENTPSDMIWDEVFDSDYFIREVVESGKECIKYRDNYCAEMRKSFGFEMSLEGFNGYALSVYGFGSKAFGTLMDRYDFCASFIFDGKLFTVSLYSQTIDVSEICKKFGGGGHTGAAGFTCETLPFIRK